MMELYRWWSVDGALGTTTSFGLALRSVIKEAYLLYGAHKAEMPPMLHVRTTNVITVIH